MEPHCTECCANIKGETVSWRLHRAFTYHWQRPWSSRDEGHVQIELMTRERASNKLVSERWDEDNDSGVTVDVKLRMSQWSIVTPNQALGSFRRWVASRLRKALIPFCSALVRLPWHTPSSPGPPSLKGIWRNWRGSCRELPWWAGAIGMCPTRRGGGSWYKVWCRRG